MPELPEVETIKICLEKAIIGKKITGVEVLLAKQFQGKKEDVVGAEITTIERKGKILKISLSNGKSLLFHFKLTGQLVWVKQSRRAGEQKGERITLGHPIPFAGTKLPAKTTHVIFKIDSGKLFFNDLRQFGWIKIIENSKLQIVNSELGKLGVEPFSGEFTEKYLKTIFSKTTKPIKLVLMDQEKIAGIGNIYANEALFEAEILPERPAKKLRNKEIKKLREAIIQVLEEGIKYGGSSIKDESFIKPNATPGSYQKHFRVYQRDGQPCLRCGTIIIRINLGGRGTYYCSKCQK